MSDRNLISASPEFYRAVEALRELDVSFMLMAVWAAMNWDTQRLEQAKRDGDIPGNAAALSAQRTVN
jgi:hypothetical protein